MYSYPCDSTSPVGQLGIHTQGSLINQRRRTAGKPDSNWKLSSTGNWQRWGIQKKWPAELDIFLVFIFKIYFLKSENKWKLSLEATEINTQILFCLPLTLLKKGDLVPALFLCFATGEADTKWSLHLPSFLLFSPSSDSWREGPRWGLCRNLSTELLMGNLMTFKWDE